MTPKPFLLPAVEKARSSVGPLIEEAMKKAMLDMSHELMASAKGKRPIRTAVSVPWPFGTVVRSKGFVSWESHRLMVLSDNGQSFTGLLLNGTVETPSGTLLEDTLRDNWEPES